MDESVCAEKSAAVRTWFVCASCGHRRGVTIAAKGVGSSDVYEDNAERAEREAWRIAEESLAVDVSDSLKLLRCPSCGKRSVRELVSLALWTVLPFTLFAGLAVWMFMFTPLLGLCWTIAALLVVVAGNHAYARAGRNVTFDP